MTGRDIFEKYSKIIDLISCLFNIFPKKVQVWMFNKLRNITGKKGYLFRYVLLKNIARKCGENVLINTGVIIKNVDKIEFGSNVSIQEMCYVEGAGGISIGDNVSIAHQTSILTTTHTYDDRDTPIKYQPIESKKVVIENNVWIGCKATILYGVSIANGAIIGANSLVNKSVDEESIVAGIPAEKIRERYTK